MTDSDSSANTSPSSWLTWSADSSLNWASVCALATGKSASACSAACLERARASPLPPTRMNVVVGLVPVLASSTRWSRRSCRACRPCCRRSRPARSRPCLPVGVVTWIVSPSLKPWLLAQRVVGQHLVVAQRRDASAGRPRAISGWKSCVIVARVDAGGRHCESPPPLMFAWSKRIGETTVDARDALAAASPTAGRDGREAVVVGDDQRASG